MEKYYPGLVRELDGKYYLANEFDGLDIDSLTIASREYTGIIYIDIESSNYIITVNINYNGDLIMYANLNMYMDLGLSVDACMWFYRRNIVIGVNDMVTNSYREYDRAVIERSYTIKSIVDE